MHQPGCRRTLTDINLNDFIGSGTHWVCYYNYYFFDPFEMLPPIIVVKCIKDIKNSDIQYQHKKGSFWILLLVSQKET